MTAAGLSNLEGSRLSSHTMKHTMPGKVIGPGPQRHARRELQEPSGIRLSRNPSGPFSVNRCDRRITRPSLRTDHSPSSNIQWAFLQSAKPL